MEPTYLIVGYTVEAKPLAWEDVEFKPDSRLTDPIKIQASLDSKRAVYESQAAYSKGLGRLTSICCVDVTAGTIAKCDAEADNELVLAKLLLARYPTAFSGDLSSSDRAGIITFIGFDAKPFVRILGFEAAAAGYPVPVRLWYNNQDCFDPYEVCVESEMRSYLPLAKFLRALKMEVPADYTPHVDAELDCKLAYLLAMRLHLLPTARQTCKVSWPADRVTIREEPTPEPESEETHGLPRRRVKT